MSQKQWKRWEALQRIRSGVLTVALGAQVLDVSRRQAHRLLAAVDKRGRVALVHGNKGRAPANRVEEATRRRVVALLRGRYAGLNDVHLTEMLAEEHQVRLSASTVRRIRRSEGLGAARKRRAVRHRARRDRKPQAGMMILWDGSRHAWLEDRGPVLALVAAVDDATGELLPGAHFVEQECAAAYLKVLLAIAREKGLPGSIYMDKHGSLRRNDDFWTLGEELRGEQDPTQVGRAIEALGIAPIFAHSPQAKGRIERPWGTLQDRLVAELRLAGVRTIEEANAFLERYRLRYNQRFAKPAADARLAWRAVPRGIDLDRVCSFRYEATVLNDNTVRLGGQVLDIPAGPGGRGYAKARVEVRQLLDGSWRIYKGDDLIATARSTAVGELRAGRRRKRPAASEAFRRTVEQVEAAR